MAGADCMVGGDIAFNASSNYIESTIPSIAI